MRLLSAFSIRLFALVLCISCAAPAATLERALNRMYNFDFNGADQEMNSYIAGHPEDPLGYTFRASALLFRELDRLSILEAEFFSSNKRVMSEKKLIPDAKLKDRFLAAIEQSKAMARARLVANTYETNALFALCLNAGLITDYMGLIEKRQLGSLAHAKESHSYAVKLLKIDPGYTDAYLTTGLTEYLLGTVPFFVKWFVRFEEAEGNKTVAVERLKAVVDKGKYLGPFAKILLAIVDVREKRHLAAEMKLAELSRDFPENSLFKKELEKLRPKLR